MPTKYYKNTASYFWRTKTFKTKEQMDRFIEWRRGSYQIVEIFINNGFGVEYRKLKKM